MSKLDILVGADPELFMFRDGQFVSAHGAIPGDKKNPHKVDKGAVQVDGMALEFNIDPAKNAEEFALNLKTVMGTLASMVPGHELKAVPVAHFSKEVFAAQPAEALVLGCEPDFNAYTGKENPRPNGEVPFRTGAGHVHIGWGKDLDIRDPDHFEACIMATRQLDYYLGLGSLLFDEDQERRQMYGAAGAFRPKPYGVEYRVLSNAWLRNEDLMKWVFDATKLGIQKLTNGECAYTQFGEFAKRTIGNEGRISKDTVKEYLHYFKIPLPKVA